MPNLVETALIEYIQERQDKQGILLTPEGGYYLYGGQFCPIQAFDLSLAADGLCLQGASSVPLDLFFGLAGGEKPGYAVRGAKKAPLWKGAMPARIAFGCSFKHI